jgi:thiol-disulfide isomerase/thioredoxin
MVWVSKFSNKHIIIKFNFKFHLHFQRPCQTIAPYFEQLSKTFSNIKFVKVDVDELQSLSSEVGVR